MNIKKILLTNDDGFDSISLKKLEEALLNNFNDVEVYVVAPKSQKSGVSYSITLFKPVEFLKIDDYHYKIDSK